MSKSIDLIFTRDFSLTVNDLWHEVLSVSLAHEYGKGLPGQIIHFTGRSAECYRILEELLAVKQAVLEKELADPLYSEERTRLFRADVDAMKLLLSQKQKTDYEELKKMFLRMYPQYMLSVFLPYRWKEDFLSRHMNSDAAQSVLERIYQNRVYSEGMFNYMDAYLRCIMIDAGVPLEYAMVVRLSEFERLLHGEKVPDVSVLQERKNGYILFYGHLYTNLSFDLFLQQHDFAYDSPSVQSDSTQINGVCASKGYVRTGSVQVILNSVEVRQFKAGNILVTTMTSPDYITAMKTASAIVTDEGGVTCHAAIVSRELGIPCVIGTKIATRVLKDGDRVEVDANRGIVKKL